MLDILLLNRAISILYPNVGYSIDGTNLGTLKFIDDTVANVDAILIEYDKVQTEHEAKQYQRDRAPAYPSIQEQLDLLYWDKINGTDNWEQAIAAVKAAHPKG